MQESDYHSHVERCRNMSQILPALESGTKAPRERKKRNETDLHLPPIQQSTPSMQPVRAVLNSHVYIYDIISLP